MYEDLIIHWLLRTEVAEPLASKDNYRGLYEPSLFDMIRGELYLFLGCDVYSEV